MRDDSVLLDVMLSAKATAPEAKTALDVQRRLKASRTAPQLKPSRVEEPSTS